MKNIPQSYNRGKSLLNPFNTFYPILLTVPLFESNRNKDNRYKSKIQLEIKWGYSFKLNKGIILSKKFAFINLVSFSFLEKICLYSSIKCLIFFSESIMHVYFQVQRKIKSHFFFLCNSSCRCTHTHLMRVCCKFNFCAFCMLYCFMFINIILKVTDYHYFPFRWVTVS